MMSDQPTPDPEPPIDPVLKAIGDHQDGAGPYTYTYTGPIYPGYSPGDVPAEPATDTWTVRAVVVILGVVCVVGYIGLLVLIGRGPNGLDPVVWGAQVALVAQTPTAALTAVAAVLASTRSRAAVK